MKLRLSNWKFLMGVIVLITLGWESFQVAAQTITNVPWNKTQTVSVVLKPQNESKLTKYIYRTADPKSSQFRHFLSTKQFASKYGHSRKNVAKLKQYFKKYHLTAKMYPGNLVMLVSGKTSNINQAFNVNLTNVKKKREIYQKTNRAPRLAAPYQKSVLAIVGLNTYPRDSFKQGNTTMQSNLYTKRAVSGGTKYDSPAKFIKRYNVDSGDGGAKKTIGIVTFANYHQADVYKYWQKYGLDYKAKRLSNYRVAGYKSSWNNYDETTLDIQQAGFVAPKANIRAYIAQSNVLGMINSLATAAGQNKVDILSISWGKSEDQLKDEIKRNFAPKNYNHIMNLLFKQLAAQGISTFVSSGDNGAYDGVTSGLASGPSVDTPANSPYVTAVGGTTIPKTYVVNKKKVKIKKERAWSTDFLYPNFDHQHFFSEDDWLTSYFSGGGGGFSKYNPTPAYQKKVSGVNTYRAMEAWVFQNSDLYRLKKPRLVKGSRSGRNVPDLSVNADPNTGYGLYYSSAKSANKGGKWYVTGGTSVAAPQVAAAFSLMNADRLGFINPQIYRLAKIKHSPFTPLDSAKNNNNLYYTGQPGKLYNQATGLGVADFSELGSRLD